MSKEKKEVSSGVGFVLGGLAGIVGASTVFPLDSIKTRLQNQSFPPEYHGVLHCAKTVIAKEGVVGLYRGLPAQWVGIAPEKAVKLGVNAALRKTLRDRRYAKGERAEGDTARTFRLPVHEEAFAGAMAGLAHVGVTSPYEMVKIRLQLAAETGGQSSIVGVVREIGLKNMFRGASACLYRDVFFSILYFGSYHPLRHQLGGGTDPTFLQQLFAGTIAGSFSSGLSTPFDVIKTRLQAQQKHELSTSTSSSPGQVYRSVFHCGSTIMKEEGTKALFKGIVPRLLIISPLFGITFLVYESLVSMYLWSKNRS